MYYHISPYTTWSQIRRTLVWPGRMKQGGKKISLFNQIVLNLFLSLRHTPQFLIASFGENGVQYVNKSSQTSSCPHGTETLLNGVGRSGTRMRAQKLVTDLWQESTNHAGTKVHPYSSPHLRFALNLPFIAKTES